MKLETKRWLARSAFVALVAVGTLIAGPRIAAARDCSYPTAGTCPPLESGYLGTCWWACKDIGFEGGTCIGSCCRCML